MLLLLTKIKHRSLIATSLIISSNGCRIHGNRKKWQIIKRALTNWNQNFSDLIDDLTELCSYLRKKNELISGNGCKYDLQ